MGGSATNVLTLNGGTMASDATRSFANTKYGGGIVIGGNVQFGELAANVPLASSSANLSFANNVSLGAATRTLTLGNSGTMTFSGVISNTANNGRNQQIGGLNSTSGTNATASNNTVTSSTSATLTISGTGNYSYGDATNTNSGIIAGAISFVKNGSGTQTLGDANTYTGTTSVLGGKLIIAPTGSLANTLVTVGGASASGTPTLGGGGIIAGATTLAAASGGAAGTHAPGISGVSNGVATQNFSSTLTYGSGSIFEWDLVAASIADPGAVANVLTGTYDQVVSAGAVTGGAAVFKVVIGGNSFTDAFWNTNKSWTNIFTGAGAPTLLSQIFSSFSPTGGLDSSGGVAGQGLFSFNGSTATLNWTAVPEPTSAMAVIVLGAGLMRRRRIA